MKTRNEGQLVLRLLGEALTAVSQHRLCPGLTDVRGVDAPPLVVYLLIGSKTDGAQYPLRRPMLETARGALDFVLNRNLDRDA